jgi:phage-related holin
MKHTMSKLFTHIEALVGWALGFGLGFFTPIAPFITVAVTLVFVDAVTGVRAAAKRKEKITSRGFFRTLEKIFVYTAAILGCEAVRVVFIPSMPITYGAALAIATTELKSILENTTVVSGTKIFDKIKDLIPIPGKDKSKSEPDESEEQ